MKQTSSARYFVRWALASGVLATAVVLPGCGSGDTGAPPPPAQDAKPAEPAPAKGPAGKSKLDTTSRRERHEMLKQKRAAAPEG
jgi:hypothetical protein